jgi:hypothetical protein
MHRWLTASGNAASHVADRSSLWLIGALAWMVTVGWLALIVGVAAPPTVAELTFFGAGTFTSGLWPWNGIAILVVLLLLVGLAIVLDSLAEAALLGGRRASSVLVQRSVIVSAICLIPLLAITVAFGASLYMVAPGTFNDPDGGPLLRTILALAPFAAGMVLAALLASAVRAAAIRARADASPWKALAAAPARLRRAGMAAAVQVVALFLASIGYLFLTAMLLRVLWAPIAARLSEAGFDVAVILLLVGFVAIWLCLVLAGGALHAWGSVSWTRLLEVPDGEAAADPQPVEGGYRP